MRREIQIEKISFSNGQVTFKIVKQTYRGREFTLKGKEFKASNGIKLGSYDFPEVGYDENLLCMRGRNTSRDNRILKCDVVRYNKILDAIDEYNKIFGGFSISNTSIGNRYKENLKNPRKEVSF